MTCPNCQQEIKPGAMFCGNCGFKLSEPTPIATVTHIQPAQPSTPITVPEVAAVDEANHHNRKAIAALVLGILGCIGWLVPIIGLVLGVLALIFGTSSLKSKHKNFARTGVILSVPVILVSIFLWVYGAQQYVKNHPANGTVAQTDSSHLQTISNPCFSTKIPASMKVTETAGNCTFNALDSVGGEQYQIKVLQAPNLTADNLAVSAQKDAQNVINLIAGGSIDNQASSTFADSPAYQVNISSTDGSKAVVDYVYEVSPQGNLVVIFHGVRKANNIDLANLENSWAWK